jgi:hypothetical protein
VGNGTPGVTGGSSPDTGAALGTGINGAAGAGSGRSSPSTITDTTRSGLARPPGTGVGSNYLNNGLDTMNGSTLGQTSGSGRAGAGAAGSGSGTTGPGAPGVPPAPAR